MKKIEVVAAVIKDGNGKIFCAKRNDKGETAHKWEFPGGKIEQGETKEEALIREIKEELSAEIIVRDYITTVTHQYQSFHITMYAYYAEVVCGELVLSEHTDFRWLDKKEFECLDWAEADKPILKEIL